MLRRSLKMLVLGVGIAIGAAPALAQGVPATAAPPAHMQYANVEFEASLGIMQGEANEYVYPRAGHKISQLVWAFDNNPVLNLGAAVRPLDWLALGIRARFNIGDESKMDDYDWLPSCPNGFCHSWHRFTELEQYVSVDAYVAARFYETSWINLKALAGWKRDSARWTAFDGNSNYTPAEPNRPAIYYNQVWNAPYLGLQANAEWQRWTLQGRVIGSWWVYGQDEDFHYLRSTLFSENFGQSNMVGANDALGYRVTENLMLKADYDLQRWEMAKGPAKIRNYETGKYTFAGWNAAGAQSISQTVSVGAVLSY
jgi:outer membrane protease